MNRLVIYGAGGKAIQVAQIIHRYLDDVTVCYCIENKQFQKIGTELMVDSENNISLPVISLHHCAKLYQESQVDGVVFPSSFHVFDWKEIYQLCISAGISEEAIFTVPIDILKKSELAECDKNRILTPYLELNQIYHLDIHVTDNCNLSCKGCAHFSPLVKEDTTIPLNNIKNNLLQLKKLVPEICDIAVLGGEPLLHPDLAEIVKVVRETYCHADINIVTNGILLTKMTEELIETLKEFNIGIILSLYPPMKGSLEKWLAFLREHSLMYQMMEFDTFERRLWWEPVFDGEKMTRKCGHDFVMSGSTISRCPMIAFVSYYNCHFGKRFPEDGRIDIFEMCSGRQLLEELEKARGLCDFCCARDHCYEQWENCPAHRAQENDWMMNLPQKLVKRELGEQDDRA